MVYAAVAMCPTFGGALQWFDANVVLGMPGVLRVMPLSPAMGAQSGIAVVAQHYWQARQALAKLPVRWDAGRHGTLDTVGLMRQLRTALDGEKGWSYHDRGDGADALAGAAKSIKAEYSAPLLAHAAMEPINCTAQFKEGKLTLWVSTQVPGLAKQLVGSVLGLASENVTVVTKLLGGGFGRRLEMDFIAQAALVAKLTEGKPVQVIWSREEDMRHDAYRPPAVTQWQGGLDAQGNLFALVSKSASGSVVYDFTKRALPAFAAQTPDKTTDEGLFDRPYEVANQSHRQVAIDSPVPLGFWRSVGHSMNAFFAESFMDECAAAAGKDPLEFRRVLLKNHPRHLKVLDTAAQKAGWGSPVAAGRARGIALHQSFGSIVAEVAEVSLEEGKPRVHKVWAAIDCGIAVNPNIIAQQIESAVLFGLSAALYGEITLKDGAVVQGNYNDYAVLRGKDAPEVETSIIDSSEAPTGVGEPGTPPIAPAVANALFTLTGKRLRSLPLRLG
jgi:isoquinoline 1-oxidoreductase beta subunit